MNEQYDFYGMGLRDAPNGLIELKKKAITIEQNYGIDARIQFESGIAMKIPVYAEMIYNENDLKKDIINGTTDYGKENTRNNSYFGSYGVGVQFKPQGGYNDPTKGKSKR